MICEALHTVEASYCSRNEAGKGDKGGTSLVDEVKPVVVLNPKPSTFRFTSKHPMQLDHSPTRPDE